MKATAEDFVIHGTRVFARNMLERHPKHTQVVLACRDDLSAYFASIHEATSNQLDNLLRQYRGRFFDLSFEQYLRFCAAFHAEEILMRLTHHESVAYMMLDGVLDLYGLPDGCQAEWIECVAAYKQGFDDYPNLLGVTRYQKIRPILQLGKPEPREIHCWNLFATHVADLAESKRSSPKWRQVVENVLGDH